MTHFLTILEKTIRFILHNMQPIIVILLLIAAVIANVALIASGEYSKNPKYPWEKEERKKARAEAKRKKLEEKERIKFWQG